ncbi:MAG: LemA family protein [Phycisphaerales bacterium]|nr:LemA family protein [Phycisphaerales bacterium]
MAIAPVLIILAVLGVVALAIVGWVAGIYNKLVRVRQHLKDSWSGVDVELKRRYDLIPNLVNTVKGYAAHEKDTLESVIKYRNQAAGNNGSVASQAADETKLVGALRQLAVVVESYPQLKADKGFVELQGQLAETEDRIAAARRFYNGNVRDMNTLVEMFPSNIVAGMFNFDKAEYFEIEDEAMRQAPRVEF